LRSFSLGLEIVWLKNISKKAALKMLMKLTTGVLKTFVVRGTLTCPK